MTKVLGGLLIFSAGVLAGQYWPGGSVAQAQSASRVFELRTYTTPEGKLSALNSRFRDHTIRIFNRHGMKSLGYWVPQDAPNSSNTLIYILQHENRDAAKRSWAAFSADPEWKKISADSQTDGRIVTKVDSVFMEATDYSPIK